MATKAAFALAGLLAAFAAVSPGRRCVAVFRHADLRWCGVPAGLYLRRGAGGGFSCLSCVGCCWRSIPTAAGAGRRKPTQVAALAGRSLAALAALLGLVLTAPLSDLIALLRLRCPAVLPT